MCECMCEMFVAGTLVSLQTPHLSSNKGNIGKIQPTPPKHPAKRWKMKESYWTINEKARNQI